MDNSEGTFISNIVKEYPDMLQIVIYHNSYNIPKPSGVTKRKLTKDEKRQENIDRSIRRTQTFVSDIVQCNKFDLWCTFTFDRRKIDRTNINACRSTMAMWLHRQGVKSPDMQYLIVPETHKDGALHFHALIANYNGKLKDSGHKTKRGQVIYNLPGYRAGFTEIVKIGQSPDDYARIGNYVSKYITKDMIMIFNKKRYWCSQGLVRPTTHVNGLSRFNLWDLVKSTKPTYINNDYELFHFPTSGRVLHPENQVELLLDENITSPPTSPALLPLPLLNH